MGDPITPLIFLTGLGIKTLRDRRKKKLEKAQLQAQHFAPAKIYQRNPNLVDGIASNEAMKKAKLRAWRGYYCGHTGEGVGEEEDAIYGGGGHIQVIGGTGDGKSSSFLQRNAGHLGMSDLIVESKDEETLRTMGRHLARRGPVKVVRPHGGTDQLPKGIEEVSYNLLSPVIYATPDAQIDVSESIATGWVSGTKSTHDNTAFFSNYSVSVMAPSMVAMVRYGSDEERSLPAIARALNENALEFFQRMAEMGDPELTPLFLGFINEIEMKSRAFNDALQTLKVELKELMGPRVAKAFSGPPSRLFAELGARPSTVILSERTNKTSVSKIQGVFLSAAFQELLTLDRPQKVRIRVHLEEAHALGGLPALPHVLLTGRSYGLQICGYWNDIGVLRRNFPADYTSILANSSVLLFLGGTKEKETAQLVSEMSGTTDCIIPNHGFHCDLQGLPTVNGGRSVGQRPVLAQHDFSNMPTGTAVAFVKNCPGVVLLRHRPWFKTWRRFVYGKNPFHS